MRYRTEPDSIGLQSGLTNRTPDSLYRVRSGESGSFGTKRTEIPVRFKGSITARCCAVTGNISTVTARRVDSDRIIARARAARVYKAGKNPRSSPKDRACLSTTCARFQKCNVRGGSVKSLTYWPIWPGFGAGGRDFPAFDSISKSRGRR